MPWSSPTRVTSGAESKMALFSSNVLTSSSKMLQIFGSGFVAIEVGGAGEIDEIDSSHFPRPQACRTGFEVFGLYSVFWLGASISIGTCSDTQSVLGVFVMISNLASHRSMTKRLLLWNIDGLSDPC